VPRAYDIFSANEGMEEETININKLKTGKCNKNSIFFFQKPKSTTYEVGSV
jgi:hypothetical protein